MNTFLEPPSIVLDHDLIFFGLIPVLLFGSARCIKLQDLRAVAPAAVLFATVGLLIAAGTLAAGMAWFFALPFLDALLFAVPIAATDPVAVARVLERFNAPKRLRSLIESESMFNDGTTVVLFSIVSATIFGRESFVAEHPVVGFMGVVFGGAVVGIVAGYLGNALMVYWKVLHDQFIGTMMPLITVYATFVLAERLLEVSGIIAVMAATLTLASLHARRDEGHMHGDGEDLFFERIWSFLGTVVDAILFFALGSMIGEHAWNLSGNSLPFLIVLLLAARAISVYSTSALLRPTRWRIRPSWQHVLNVAGLKGAVSVALLLLIPHDYEFRQLFLCGAFVLVLFTVLVNPLAGRFYLNRARLDEPATR